MPEQYIEIPHGQQDRYVWLSDDGTQAVRPIRIANGNWIVPARIIPLLRGRSDFDQLDLDDLEAISPRVISPNEVRQAPRNLSPGPIIRGRRR